MDNQDNAQGLAIDADNPIVANETTIQEKVLNRKQKRNEKQALSAIKDAIKSDITDEERSERLRIEKDHPCVSRTWLGFDSGTKGGTVALEVVEFPSGSGVLYLQSVLYSPRKRDRDAKDGSYKQGETWYKATRFKVAGTLHTANGLEMQSKGLRDLLAK